MNNIEIQFVNQYKILGMIFDSKLLWTQHIEYIRKICTNQMRILKYLTNTSWGSSRNVLMK